MMGSIIYQKKLENFLMQERESDSINEHETCNYFSLWFPLCKKQIHCYGVQCLTMGNLLIVAIISDLAYLLWNSVQEDFSAILLPTSPLYEGYLCIRIYISILILCINFCTILWLIINLFQLCRFVFTTLILNSNVYLLSGCPFDIKMTPSVRFLIDIFLLYHIV